MPYIRDRPGSNTLPYIRPMESCLSLDKPPQPVTNQSPQTHCPKCSLSIPNMQLRKHYFTCRGTEVHDSDSSDEELKRSPSDRVLPGQQNRVEGNFNVQQEVPLLMQGLPLLTVLFHDESIGDVREALLKYEDVDLAAYALMSRTTTDAAQASEEDEGGNNVCDTLENLRAKIKSSVSAGRLKVDEDDCFSITSPKNLTPRFQSLSDFEVNQEWTRVACRDRPSQVHLLQFPKTRYLG